MPELIKMYNSGNSTVDISNLYIWCGSLNLKVENHLGYNFTLTPAVTYFKIYVSVFEEASVHYMYNMTNHSVAGFEEFRGRVVR